MWSFFCSGFSISNDTKNSIVSDLKHRGPDDNGIYHDEHALIIMTRLAMSDNKDYSIPVIVDNNYIAFNGELYPKGGLDTDLISEINLLDWYFQRKIHPENSMFSYIKYNKKTKQLIFSRDHFGQKPLYIYHNNDKIILSSEIRPMLHLIRPSMNKSAVIDLLTVGHPLWFETIYSDIKIVEPGLYFKLEYSEVGYKTIEKIKLDCSLDLVEEFNQSLFRSVSECASGFRDTGVLLSSGIDSYLLYSQSKCINKAFNLSFNGVDKAQDDVKNLKNQDIRDLDTELLLKKAVASYQQPTRMTSIIMCQAFSELINKEGYRKVILGEGADELFQGYPRHNIDNWKLIDCLDDSYYFNVILNSKEKIEQIQRLFKFYFYLKEKWNDLSEKAFFDKYLSLEPLLRRADHLLLANSIEGRLPYLSNYVARHSIYFHKDGIKKSDLKNYAVKNGYRVVKKEKEHFRLTEDRDRNLYLKIKEVILEKISKLEGMGVKISKRDLDNIPSSLLFTISTFIYWRENNERFI